MTEEVKLVYLNKKKAKDRPLIKTSQDAYKVLLQHWDMNQIELMEECKVLLLDNRLRLMSIASVSKGGLSGTIVDLRIIFAIALKRRANRFILAHNHPSGSLEPSKSDIRLTQKFIKAGAILDIPVEDHLIITKDDYCSLVEDYSEELALSV